MLQTMHTMVASSARAKEEAQSLEARKVAIEESKWEMEKKEKEGVLQSRNEKLALQQLAKDCLLKGNLAAYDNVMKLLATFN